MIVNVDGYYNNDELIKMSRKMDKVINDYMKLSIKIKNKKN